MTINVGGDILVEEQPRHDLVTFPRAKAVFGDPSSVVGKAADPAAILLTRTKSPF